MSGIIFRDEDNAGGVFVQAMHDPRAERVAALRQGLTAAEKRVHQGAARIAGAGVHGHAGWFVHGDDVIVFVEDFEGNGFGLGAKGRARLDFYADALSIANAVRAFRRAGIDEHQAAVDEFLGARAAKFESRGNSLIQALPRLAFGNDKFLKRRFVALTHSEIVAAVRAIQTRMLCQLE